MNLKNLSDKELLTNTFNVVQKEKHLTTLVLEHLQEVENRKLYCDQGLPSLFAYCTRVLKYSEAEASVRVNATRIIKAVPEIKEEIQKGQMSLTNLSIAQRFFNENKTPLKEKKNILNEISGKSTRQTKKILDEKDVKKSNSLNITLNERLLKKLEKIQIDFDDCSEVEALEVLMNQYLEKKASERPHRKSNIKPKNQRYIQRAAKEAVNARAHARCEYIDPDSKKRCTARTHLHFDHVRPIALGGQSCEENLRKLCSNHNQRMRIKLNLSSG